MLSPQEPGQGSRHLLLMHANWLLHSALIVHSGLQFGGEPMKLAKHVHDGDLLIAWHKAFGPQGDGRHGLISISFGAKISIINYINVNYYVANFCLFKTYVVEL